MNSYILTNVENKIATITLNRPKRFNSLIPEFLNQLYECLSQIEDEQAAEVIILRANGLVFSTGGDLKGFKNHFSDIAAYSKTLVGTLNKVILKMLKIKLPIICEAHGMVTGGSLGLILASDLVLVTKDTTFTPYYSVVGFCPDGGWTAILPLVIGIRRTKQILMCNDTISAENAVKWGLANKIVPKNNIRSSAFKIANKIISKKKGSICITKQLLNFQIEKTANALENELKGFLEQVQTKEAQTGILDFLKEKV